MGKPYLASTRSTSRDGRYAVWDAVSRDPCRWTLATILAATEMADEFQAHHVPEELDRVQRIIADVLRGLRAAS